MSDPFLSEIRLMSFAFAPKGWALCNGQLLPINQNQALFSLLGTTFGGDGRVNFALPDLRGRVPVHVDNNAYLLGTRGGAENVTLAENQMPAHTHTLHISSALATSASPLGALPGKKGRLGRDLFAAPGNTAALSPDAVTSAGGGQPHTNMQPYLTICYAIALQGIFPSPN